MRRAGNPDGGHQPWTLLAPIIVTGFALSFGFCADRDADLQHAVQRQGPCPGLNSALRIPARLHLLRYPSTGLLETGPRAPRQAPSRASPLSDGSSSHLQLVDET